MTIMQSDIVREASQVHPSEKHFSSSSSAMKILQSVFDLVLGNSDIDF